MKSAYSKNLFFYCMLILFAFIFVLSSDSYASSKIFFSEEISDLKIFDAHFLVPSDSSNAKFVGCIKNQSPSEEQEQKFFMEINGHERNINTTFSKSESVKILENIKIQHTRSISLSEKNNSKTNFFTAFENSSNAVDKSRKTKIHLNINQRK